MTASGPVDGHLPASGPFAGPSRPRGGSDGRSPEGVSCGRGHAAAVTCICGLPLPLVRARRTVTDAHGYLVGYTQMDLFSRTMLACSAEAGLTTTALSRHVPFLRRNIRAGDQVSLLSRCVGSDGLGSGDHVLMLTGERLVVTRQSRLLGRVRLCLDAPVAAIENLRWSADPAGPGVELNFTVLEGPGAAEPHRWHFWLPAGHAKRVWRVDALLARAFRRPKAVARPVNAPRSAPAESFRNALDGASGVFLPPAAAPTDADGLPASAAAERARTAAPAVEGPTMALDHVAPAQPSARQADRPRPAAARPAPYPQARPAAQPTGLGPTLAAA